VRDGVEILTAHQLARVDGEPGRPGRARAVDGDGDRSVGYDALLLATGQRARTAGLGLDRAGVRLTDAGTVAPDARLRTTNPRIFAAGDVTPALQLTHLASYHAGIAATNALLGLSLRPDATAAPRVVYTDPEVAAVGAPTWAPPGEQAPRTTEDGHDHVDRAVTDGRTEGFTRLTVSSAGRITGATVVGPRARESLAELGLAVRRKVRVTALASTVHAYPTYGYAPWEAAVTEVRRRCGRWGLWRLTRALIRLRRAGRGRSARVRG
jgi:pyruvate/2-oxoglutarate dehydrogenase complex dihydrolipoamide dehydrogenase (E3) component